MRKTVVSFIVSFLFCLLLSPDVSLGDVTLDLVEVKTIEVVGNREIDSDTLDSVISKFLKSKGWDTKKYYKVEDLKAVADAITAYYHEQGYLLVRAYVPEQEIEGGLVTITVVEGRIKDITYGSGRDGVGSTIVSGNKYFSNWYVNSWFRGFQGTVVNELDIERTLLLMNDTPGLTGKTILRRGPVKGSSNLVVEVEDELPVGLQFEYNNYGSRSVSRHRYGAHFSFTDPFFGSTFRATGFRGESSDDTRYLNFDYSIPVTKRIRAGVRHIKADYIVGKGPMQDIGIEGKADITGGYLTYRLVRSRSENLGFTLGYDRKHMFEYMLGFVSSNDDLAVFYAGLDYDGIDRFLGKSVISFYAYRGVQDFHGSLKSLDTDASRVNSGGDFEKYSLDVARVQKIWRFVGIFKGVSQFSSDRLVNPELFGIGGPSTVRGYETSTYMGDSGYAVSAELRSPLPFFSETVLWGMKGAELINIAAFFDHGSVKRNHLLMGEEKNNDLTGVGFGVRMNLFGRLEISADRAFPLRRGHVKSGESLVYVQALLTVLKI